jgi:hypothetical protein
MNRKTVAALAALLGAAGAAYAESDVQFAGKAEALVTKFGSDYFSCWNDGVRANCTRKPIRLQGENSLRVDGSRDLTDEFTLVYRGQLGAYVNNAWYQVSNAAAGPSSQQQANPNWSRAPAVHTDVEEAWIGVRRDAFGTIRLGKGLNPRVQAIHGDGATDLGGAEMLDAMIAYDAPYILGNKGHGLTGSFAHYQGEHMRKQIRVNSVAEEANKIDPVGNALLLDGYINGWINVRAGAYREALPARLWYPGGTLDGEFTIAGNAVTTAYPLVPNSGAHTHAQGGSLYGTLDFTNFRIGAMGAVNRIAQVPMAQPIFPSTGYNSKTATLFGSAWRGPWSVSARATINRFRMVYDTLHPKGGQDYNWLYPNNTFDIRQLAGEVSYEVTKGTRAVIGGELRMVDFKEFPGADGLCQMSSTRGCYDPKASKFFAGMRSEF